MKLLFVCSGNTCRSPSAAAVTEAKLREVGYPDVEVTSAGIYHEPGGADPFAIEAAQEHDCDLTGHVARQLDARAIEDADRVFVMEQWQVEEITTHSSAAKVICLDIDDPKCHHTKAAYQEMWEQLNARLDDELWKTLPRRGQRRS